ncbi:MAG: copper resistance protein CopC [Actinomycetales bacterium]|nr:copper resistance protein CopC [Actinomycetales bacterium]
MRKLLVTIAALVAGLALTFTGAAAATAHSELEGSVPAQGLTVSTVTELVLTFSEAIVPDYSTVVLADSAGIPVELGAPTYDSTGTAMTIPIVSGALPNGDYIAGFRIVSVDGHPIAGEVDFTVTGSDAPALVAPAPSDAATASDGPMATDGSATLLVTSQNDGPNVLVIIGSIFAALVALGLVTVVLLVAIRRNRAKAAATTKSTDLK